MKRHPMIGYKIVKGIKFLERSSEVILYHHEKFDGSGYPHGLAGEDIPLLARIFSVSDAYDAIISDRPTALAAAMKKPSPKSNAAPAHTLTPRSSRFSTASPQKRSPPKRRQFPISFARPQPQY